MNSIPEKIKAYRKSLGLTQEEFGAQLGVTKGTIYSWEAGNRNPPFKVLNKLGMLYECVDNTKTDRYKEIFQQYCELSDFDKDVVFALITTERKRSCT